MNDRFSSGQELTSHLSWETRGRFTGRSLWDEVEPEAPVVGTVCVRLPSF